MPLLFGNRTGGPRHRLLRRFSLLGTPTPTSTSTQHNNNPPVHPSPPSGQPAHSHNNAKTTHHHSPPRPVSLDNHTPHTLLHLPSHPTPSTENIHNSSHYVLADASRTAPAPSLPIDNTHHDVVSDVSDDPETHFTTSQPPPPFPLPADVYHTDHDLLADPAFEPVPEETPVALPIPPSSLQHKLNIIRRRHHHHHHHDPNHHHQQQQLSQQPPTTSSTLHNHNHHPAHRPPSDSSVASTDDQDPLRPHPQRQAPHNPLLVLTRHHRTHTHPQHTTRTTPPNDKKLPTTRQQQTPTQSRPPPDSTEPPQHTAAEQTPPCPPPRSTSVLALSMPPHRSFSLTVRKNRHASVPPSAASTSAPQDQARTPRPTNPRGADLNVPPSLNLTLANGSTSTEEPSSDHRPYPSNRSAPISANPSEQQPTEEKERPRSVRHPVDPQNENVYAQAREQKIGRPQLAAVARRTLLRIPRSASTLLSHQEKKERPMNQQATSSPPIKTVRDRSAAPQPLGAVPRSASLFAPRTQHSLSGRATPPPQSAEVDESGAPASATPSREGFPRSSSLFTPPTSTTDAISSSARPWTHRGADTDRSTPPPQSRVPRSASLFIPPRSNGQIQRAPSPVLPSVPSSRSTVGRRESGVALAQHGGPFVSSRSFSPGTSNLDCENAAPPSHNIPKSMSANFSIPTGWPGQIEHPQSREPTAAELKKKREEERLEKARQQVYTLNPEDPDFRKRRRTAAVNLYSTFKEELPHFDEDWNDLRKWRKSEAGGPGFARRSSSKVRVG